MKSAVVKRILSIMMTVVLLAGNVMPVMAEGAGVSGNEIEAIDEDETEEASSEEAIEEESSEEESSVEELSEEESSEELSSEEEATEEESTEEVSTEEDTTEEETTEEETTEILDEEVPMIGTFNAVKPADEGKVTVTIEHYLGDSDDEDNTLFIPDEVKVDNGGKVSDFAKGLEYFEVNKIELDGNPVSLDENGKLLISIGQEEESSEDSENIEEAGATEELEESNEPLTAVIKVYYSATTDDDYINEVAVIDYKDGDAGDKDTTSINVRSNYPSDSKPENRFATKGAQANYGLYVDPKTGAKTDGRNGVNANNYCGDPGTTSTPIVKGLLSGVLDGGKGDVDFTYDDPGFFSQDAKIGKEILDGYELKFDRIGVEYDLNSVLLNGSEVEEDYSLTNFFPLPKDEKIEIEKEYIWHDGYWDGQRYHNGYLEIKEHEKVSYVTNEYFGMRYDFDFSIGDYVGDMNYTFTGDDDLWVCLDGEVILDLGGIHMGYPTHSDEEKEEQYGLYDYAPNSVDLWDLLLEKEGLDDTIANRIAYATDNKDVEHRITVVYMERGGVKSNCTMKFTMPNIEGSEAHVTANPRADLTFTKVEQGNTSKGLEGATFKLINKADLVTNDGEPVDYTTVKGKEVTSDANGVVKFEKLKIGEYLLKETDAPEGYMRTGIEWTVKVELVDDDTAEATLYRGNTPITTIENVKATHALSQNKEAELVNWDDRTYKITLDASSLLNQEVFTGPVDITLAIDVSASMLCPASLTSIGTKAVSELDKSKMYYYIDGIGTKAVWCDNNQWKAFETSSWNYGKKPSEQWDRLITLLGEDDTREFFVSENYTNVLLDTSKTVNEYDRMHAMKDAVKNFVEDVANISPESTIGVVIFGAVNEGKTGPDANCNKEVIGLTKLDATGINNLSAAIDGIAVSPRGATFTNKGLALANEQIAESSADVDNRFVVLITDGAPNAGTLPESGLSSVDEEIRYYAEEIKTKATLVTMGVGIDGDNTAKSLMQSIASVADDNQPYAYTVTQADGMNGMLQLIGNTILSMIPIENATIVDYIDERFEVTDADGNALSVGTKILDNFGNEGTLCNDNGRWYVKWTGVTIPSSTNEQPGWFAEINVKAKEDFLGGNMVATNGADSGITFEGTIVPFDKPSVNVKLRDLVIENGEITLFKGETITPADYLAELNGTVKVVEDASQVTIVEDAVALASAPVLTDAQKKELVTNKKLSVPYTYANDTIGAFEYAVESKADLKDHEAVKVGETEESVVEEYTLSVVYKANSLEERKDNAPEGLEAPNTVENTPSFDGVEVVESNTAVGTYKVHVVAGSLVINKEIEPSEIDFSHGDPIFTFKVMKDGEFFSYHTVRFTEGTDGKMSVDSDVLSELPKGVYTVEELDTVRYELASVEAKGVGTYAANVPDSKKAEFGIGRTVSAEETVLNNRDGEVTFTNVKEKELNFSDTDVAVNTFTIGEDGSISWVRKNTPGNE